MRHNYITRPAQLCRLVPPVLHPPIWTIGHAPTQALGGYSSRPVPSWLRMLPRRSLRCWQSLTSIGDRTPGHKDVIRAGQLRMWVPLIILHFTNWWCPLVFQDAFPRCDSILTAFALTLVFKPEIEIGSQPFCTSTTIENTLIKMQNRFISRNVSLLCLVRFPTFEHSKMCD